MHRANESNILQNSNCVIGPMAHVIYLDINMKQKKNREASETHKENNIFK